ncbi:hypothetical protein C7999DRAFT_10033 [Corynascus novoguineensis]|uniref:Uncharacterized protein n=1 Tax=Corynascus novoguineensis TaxID=1126955 RepID=A0AAN7HJD1_9PEZI|nr:hypothetical protein C7999DRAFT_10033 [Corynascus novoguineensis]
MGRYAGSLGLPVSPPRAIPRPTHFLGRTSSVDLIAEQYQAVLESRHTSVYSGQEDDDKKEVEVEDGWEPALSPTNEDSDDSTDSRCSLPHEEAASFCDSARVMAEFPNASPGSDDGTLVSFQGDTVYFKPVSFSPMPSPAFVPGPRHEHEYEYEHEHGSEFDSECESPTANATPLSRQMTSAEDDNVSLQICLDLLTRELSSAMPLSSSSWQCGGDGGGGGPHTHPPTLSAGTSALQVWVMIEAYERLRDQMAELGATGNYEQAREMERMFDMWLRALYSVHGSMAERARKEA